MRDLELIESVKKMQKGDISELEIIYKKTSKDTYKVLFSYTKNEQLSLDLLQDTYITLSEKIENVEKPEFIRNFINTVAINKARNYYKKSKKEVLVAEENEEIFKEQKEEDINFLPQEILDSKEKQKIVRDIIDGLSIEQKTTVYLYYYNELSIAEIAKEMECSEGTVKSRLNYARKKIKVEVEKWTEKGTKLYSTSIPILLIVITNQINEIQAPLKAIDKLFKNIMIGISSTGIIGSAVGVKGTSSVIGKTAVGLKKAFMFKIAGGITAATVVLGVYIANQKQPEEITSIYYSYSSLGIEHGIKAMNVYNTDYSIFTTSRSDEERYVKFDKQENFDNEAQDVVITDTENKDHVVKLVIENGKMTATVNNTESNHTYMPYKEFTDGNIVKAESSDDAIIYVIKTDEKHEIEIVPVSAGEATVKLKDDKGGKSEFIVSTKYDENGVCYIASTGKLTKCS